MFDVTFWGVRGSTAVPGTDTHRVGGNTSCVEVRAGTDLIILDAGTGIRKLGEALTQQGPITAHLFLSHVHWDHTQGLPFFRPAYERESTIHIYGGHHPSISVETALRAQIAEPHFPVAIDRFAAKLAFHIIKTKGAVTLPSGAKVSAIAGNHPGGVLIYRIDYQDKSVVYATDVEYEHEVAEALIAFTQGADLFIFDAMYTPEEYEGVGKHASRGSRKGWGHSTYVAGARIAQQAHVKQYILFHHDPNQDDADVSDKVQKALSLFPNTQAAVEGLKLSII